MPETVMQFGHPPHRIDLHSAIDGVTFEQVWAGATTTTIQAQALPVIGFSELRANKCATGRKKDADDVRRLDARRKREK